MPTPVTSPALLLNAVDNFGDSLAVADEGRRVRYRDLDRESADLARRLLAMGVGKGTHVGILLPNGCDWVVAFFAITRMGAVAICLNTYSPAAELRRTLEHADVSVLVMVDAIGSFDYLERLEGAVPELRDVSSPALELESMPFLRAVLVVGEVGRVGWARSWNAGETAPPELLVAAERAVYPSDRIVLIYTSGVTGEPKGVVHAHGPMIRHAHSVAIHNGTASDDRCYTSMPLFWVGGLVVVLLAGIHVGGATLVQARFAAASALDLAERERATRLLGWAPQLSAIMQDSSYSSRDLSTLRNWGLAAPVSDPGLRQNSLGMTETNGPHTWPDTSITELPEELRGSFGVEVPGTEHRIVDPATGAVLGDGERGEVCVRGYSLMLGMYKRERSVVFDADGWYHTGDRGTFRDGHLIFTGRLDDMIKTAGANVSPREVEIALELDDGVKQAHVVGVPDAQRGTAVVAVLVPARGADIDVPAVLATAREQLAPYKVPRRVVVLDDDELPWLESGKVDRRTLAATLATDSEPASTNGV